MRREGPLPRNKCLVEALCVLDLVGLPDAAKIGHPEGGGHGWPPFSDRAMDGESENGNGTAYPLSGFDVTRKAVFFGYFLLGQQKKVPRPQGRNDFDMALQDTQHEKEFRQAARRAFA